MSKWVFSRYVILFGKSSVHNIQPVYPCRSQKRTFRGTSSSREIRKVIVQEKETTSGSVTNPNAVEEIHDKEYLQRIQNEKFPNLFKRFQLVIEDSTWQRNIKES